jgi:hypothetical protein
MTPSDPCEPLAKLVDRLNEQLDALCSQSQEHLFLQSLIDVPSLTDVTRTMLKDAERRLANCRRHPVPPSNRPFLVTLTDPNRPRHIMETHQAQARTTLCRRVTAYAGLGVFALSLGYALYENRVAQSLAAQNEQELASLTAARSQLNNLKGAIKALQVRPGLPTARATDAIIIHPTASHRQPIDGSGLKQVRLPLHTQRKVIEERPSDLSAMRGNLKTARTELTGSIAGTPDELAPSQRKGEHNNYEFDIDKSKQFQEEGSLGIRLKKADTQHQYADLELTVKDHNLSQKHVNLYQPVTFYMPDSSQPVEVVIDNISKDHIHGYVRAAEYPQPEPALKSSNAPNPVLQFRSVAAERPRAGARWHGFSVNKILSRVKLRSDS